MANKVLIFSAPSGSGKSTVVNHLLSLHPELEFSISATSRAPRGEEKDGVEYYFIDAQEFRDRIDAGEDSHKVIAERQARYPEYAEAIAMYMSRWEESLPGEVPGMYELVSRLKLDPKNRIFGLTNWSMETFPQARARFAVLQLIDNYVVSGQEGVVKPDPRIFHILLNRFGLQANECIFIDDNPANVESAVGLGFRGIQFHDAASLAKELGI